MVPYINLYSHIIISDVIFLEYARQIRGEKTAAKASTADSSIAIEVILKVNDDPD